MRKGETYQKLIPELQELANKFGEPYDPNFDYQKIGADLFLACKEIEGFTHFHFTTFCEDTNVNAYKLIRMIYDMDENSFPVNALETFF